MAGRAWIFAPDKATLKQRWNELISAAHAKKAELFATQDEHDIDKILTDSLPGFPAHHNSIAAEKGPAPDPVRVGYRSLDRQWIIPDKRLINRPNPTLWEVRSNQQVYLTTLHRDVPSSGPAATFTPEVPDVHHYKGSFGGRVFPLWLDSTSSISNIVPGLLPYLQQRYKSTVTAPDVFAYLAAILSHPGYLEIFAKELTTPGLRVPFTAETKLFEDAAEMGRRILWLYSYGQRFYDPSRERPKQAPRVPQDRAPQVLGGYPIPTDAANMPNMLQYDSQNLELHVGTGRISNVTQKMRDYEVSGVNVLNKWFGYRRKNRERPPMGDRQDSPLQETQAHSWLAEYTSELIYLLHVIGLLVELEPMQSQLLTSIIAGSLITREDLAASKVLPVSAESRKPPKASKLPAPVEGMLEYGGQD